MKQKDFGVYLLSGLLIYLTFGSDDKMVAKIGPIKGMLYPLIEVSIFSALAAIIFFAGVVWGIYQLIKRNKGRLSHGVLYATLSMVVYIEMFRHPINVPLFSLLTSSFFVAFIAEVSVFLDAKYGYSKKLASVHRGFISDNQEIADNEKVGWDKYADNLVQRLISTDTSRSSFAVGLTGKWGTGKTTFLDIMKAKFKKKNVLMLDFNPWLSDSTKMIINDYFNSLKDLLIGKEPQIDKMIDKYVNLLLKWQAPTFVDKIHGIFDSHELQGLQAIRNQISDLLNGLESPIVVFIDDMDRLQREEILEVMKLIRNTADFSNMFYLVPFDKSYVLKTIKESITEPALYLKKIFQLELKFPMFESYLFTHFLVSELERYHHLRDVKLRTDLGNLEMLLQADDIYLSDYFGNFRDIKRFVNELLLVLDYIESQGTAKDFKFYNLFLIELLNYTDEGEYEKLKNSPQDRLESHENREYYKLKADVEKDTSANTFKILHALFSSSLTLGKTTDYVSMRRKNKYYTYFSLRPFAYQMSITEFLNILNMRDEASVREEIRKTREGIFSKSAHLYDLLITTRARIMDSHTLRNYMAVVEEWTKLNIDFDRHKIVRLYNKILSSKLDNESECVDIVRKSFQRISNFLMRDYNHGCFVLQYILCSMMTGKFEHTPSGYKALINYGDSYYSSDIEVLNKKNVNMFLSLIKPSIYSIFDNYSRLHNFILSSAVYSTSMFPQRELASSVEDSMISYFSKDMVANDYNKFFSRFYYLDLSFGSDEGGDEALEKRINKYFISVPFYLRFLRECFKYENPKIVDEYINKNNLGRWTV